MDYTIFSEIEIITSCNERYLIYWRTADYYDNNNHIMKKRQVIQFATGLRVLPITFEVVLEFVKLEKGSKLHLITEERWPIGDIKKVHFKSSGDVKTIFCKK